MLNGQEEDRLYAALPTQFSVDWQGTSYSYSFETWWDDEDHDIEYPQMTLMWDVRDQVRADDQPLNDIIAFDPKENDPEVEYTDAKRVFDDLVIQCATSGETNDDGVPSKRRANEFARTVARFFHFTFAQNSVGANGERPVLAEVVQSPVYSGEKLEGETERDMYQLTVRLNHTEENLRTEDAVGEAETDTDIS